MLLAWFVVGMLFILCSANPFGINSQAPYRNSWPWPYFLRVGWNNFSWAFSPEFVREKLEWAVINGDNSLSETFLFRTASSLTTNPQSSFLVGEERERRVTREQWYETGQNTVHCQSLSNIKEQQPNKTTLTVHGLPPTSPKKSTYGKPSDQKSYRRSTTIPLI